ncbi:MAG: type II secretion system GspH family protein [Rickettsiales bacterium]|jgi:type II secretory pathway pseudopilin PulG|nr:type II secretion system GspH family protein [Rickettsiales bacterium]
MIIDKMLRNNDGFSVIELSIVLVFIGFLVICVSSSLYLLKDSSIRATVRDVGNYRAALYTYYGMNGELPAVDDGNFKFDNSCSAWHLLREENLISNLITIAPCETIYLDKKHNVLSKIENAWFALGYRNAGNSESSEFGKNSIALFGGNKEITFDDAASSVSFDRGNLSVSLEDALFIDKKMDDGNLASGDVIGVGSSSSNCKGDGSVVYNGKKMSCVLFFNIGF